MSSLGLHTWWCFLSLRTGWDRDTHSPAFTLKKWHLLQTHLGSTPRITFIFLSLSPFFLETRGCTYLACSIESPEPSAAVTLEGEGDKLECDAIQASSRRGVLIRGAISVVSWYVSYLRQALACRAPCCSRSGRKTRPSPLLRESRELVSTEY